MFLLGIFHYIRRSIAIACLTFFLLLDLSVQIYDLNDFKTAELEPTRWKIFKLDWLVWELWIIKNGRVHKKANVRVGIKAIRYYKLLLSFFFMINFFYSLKSSYVHFVFSYFVNKMLICFNVVLGVLKMKL